MTRKKAETQEEWTGAYDAFTRAFTQIKANPEPALLYLAVYVIVFFLETVGPGFGAKDSLLRSGSYEGVAYLIFLLAIPTYALALADRKRIGLGDFMRFKARTYFSMLGVTILYGLIVVLSLFALILPAVWTVAWFALCIYLVADKNLGPIQALKESKRLIQNHKSKVWGIIGLTILVAFASSLVLLIPIVGVILGPLLSALSVLLSSAATAMLYRWAQKRSTT
jgi:hypothetical protein